LIRRTVKVFLNFCFRSQLRRAEGRRRNI